MATWDMNWAWSLPLIVLTVVTHVLGRAPRRHQCGYGHDRDEQAREVPPVHLIADTSDDPFINHTDEVISSAMGPDYRRCDGSDARIGFRPDTVYRRHERAAAGEGNGQSRYGAIAVRDECARRQSARADADIDRDQPELDRLRRFARSEPLDTC